MAELHYRYGRPTTLADLAPGTLFEVEASGLRFVKEMGICHNGNPIILALADGVRYANRQPDTQVRPIEFRELGPRQKPVNPEEEGDGA